MTPPPRPPLFQPPEPWWRSVPLWRRVLLIAAYAAVVGALITIAYVVFE